MKEREDNRSNRSEEEICLISFRIGDGLYSIHIGKVKEIIRYCKITPIPKAPEFVEGVISLRGMVIPIIDMRKRFGLSSAVSSRTRIMIVQVDNKIVGILVDEVKKILKLPEENIQPPPEVAKGIGSEFLEGVCEDGEDILLILNMDRILTTTEKILLEESFNKKKRKAPRGMK